MTDQPASLVDPAVRRFTICPRCGRVTREFVTGAMVRRICPKRRWWHPRFKSHLDTGWRTMEGLE